LHPTAHVKYFGAPKGVSGVLGEVFSQVHTGTLTWQHHGNLVKSRAMALQQGFSEAI